MDRHTLASKLAYAAAVLFVIGMSVLISQAPPSTFAGAPPATIVLVTVAFTMFHLSLLPVIAALDAPAWAKGSGYAWVAVDNVIVFMSYFGVGGDLIIPMRWGIHLAASTWIFGASWVAHGALRVMGLLAVIAFVGASFAGPFVGTAVAGQTLGPAGILLVVWLVLVGVRLGKIA